MIETYLKLNVFNVFILLKTTNIKYCKLHQPPLRTVDRYKLKVIEGNFYNITRGYCAAFTPTINWLQFEPSEALPNCFSENLNFVATEA